MVQAQVRRFLPLPDYDLSELGEVKLTISSAVIDEAYSRLLMVRTDLPLEDALALDRVQKRLPITDEAVALLRKAKVIEGRRPNLHGSATVAAMTERKADYIRTRAQDDAYFAHFILDYLNQYGGASRKEIDGLLSNYLPDVLDTTQQRSKVTNLLSRIHNAGSQQKPRWELI